MHNPPISYLPTQICLRKSREKTNTVILSPSLSLCLSLIERFSAQPIIPGSLFWLCSSLFLLVIRVFGISNIFNSFQFQYSPLNMVQLMKNSGKLEKATAPVKLEIVEDPLEDEHGPLNKRHKPSQSQEVRALFYFGACLVVRKNDRLYSRCDPQTRLISIVSFSCWFSRPRHLSTNPYKCHHIHMWHSALPDFHLCNLVWSCKLRIEFIIITSY